MHKIEAFLPPSTNVDSLEETLFAAGVVSFSTTEMQVFDRKEMKTVKYRGVERVIRHNRKLKVEIIAGKDTIGLAIGALRAYQNKEGIQGVSAFVTDLENL
jgi:nitrogen regulatory protein PII